MKKEILRHFFEKVKILINSTLSKISKQTPNFVQGPQKRCKSLKYFIRIFFVIQKYEKKVTSLRFTVMVTVYIDLVAYFQKGPPKSEILGTLGPKYHYHGPGCGTFYNVIVIQRHSFWFGSIICLRSKVIAFWNVR